MRVVASRDREGDGQPQRRQDSRELIEVIRRIELLQPYEQVILLDRLIAASTTDPDKSADRVQAEKMVAAYRAIETVYERLDLPIDKQITAQEFNAVNEQLGLDWRWTRVHRAWGSWRRAMSVFMGGATHSGAGLIAQNIARRHLSTDRRPARESLRIWLETRPRRRGPDLYNAWVRDENKARAGLKHVYSDTVRNVLNTSFSRAVEDVEHEIAVGTARELLDGTVIAVAGHQLITLSGIGRLTNRSSADASQLARRRDFPRWVARVGEQVLWLKSDVERWRVGEQCISTEGMYLDLVWDMHRLARRMDLSWEATRARHKVRTRNLPPPGRPKLKAVWWDAREAETWLRAHPEHDPRQR